MGMVRWEKHNRSVAPTPWQTQGFVQHDLEAVGNPQLFSLRKFEMNSQEKPCLYCWDPLGVWVYYQFLLVFMFYEPTVKLAS
jgi:hypothetical protein